MSRFLLYVSLFVFAFLFAFLTPLGTESVVIEQPNSAITNVTGLSQPGNYAFTLTVTDNKGASDTDTVVVSVATPALPVKLSSFTASAKADHNLVEWVAETEFMVKSYELLTGTVPARLDVVHRQHPTGSGGRAVYQVKCMFPPAESYYRLKTTDEDGSVWYSKIVYVKRNVTWSVIIQSHVTGVTMAVINAITDAEAEVKIFDVSGRLHLSQKIRLLRGSNRFWFDASRFSSGMYVLSVSTINEIFYSKFIKQ